MIIASLLAAVLSVSASAQVPACKSNEMTAAWEKVTFALWLTDYTIPDSSPRTATLRYTGCIIGDFDIAMRQYVSEDGAFTVAAATRGGGEKGTTSLSLSHAGEWVLLGQWPHRKVFDKGVGIDKVAVPNGGGKTFVKNVFVIPEGAVIKP